MTTPKKKPGRRPRHHTDSNGKPIEGLARRPSDGRWRIVGTNITFTEPNEQRAIAKFHRLQRGETEPERWLRIPATKGLHWLDFNAPVTVTEVGEFSEPELWQWFADQIRERRKYVAAQTGIEEISYLSDLKAPAPLPTVVDLQKNWFAHAECSPLQRKKVARAWTDFVETTNVKNLGDITSEVAVAYKDAVKSRSLSKKQQQHLFTGVRRVLSFSIERCVAVDAASKALAYLKCLKGPRSAVTLDPNPIDVDDWKKLLATAEADDKALILLMLNGAFCIQEAIDLEWSDIRNGCIATHREKTGKCVRVCVLWKETLEALDTVEPHGEKIFYSYQGAPLKVCGAQRRFRRLAIRAGLSTPGADGKPQEATVTASQLRDGALTAAAAANVNSQLCKLLAGHRCGIDDHYVKRNPKMVAPACDAVYQAYMSMPAAQIKAA